MWDKIGPSVLAGISILLVLSVTINSMVFYSKKTLDPKIALLTDRRMNLINELISKIKVYSNSSPNNAQTVILAFPLDLENVRLGEAVRENHLAN